MSDAIPLPARPNLEQYKKRAKEFQRACNSGDPDAIRNWAGDSAPIVERVLERWQRDQPDRCTLTQAQFFLARVHGFASWPKFSRHIQALAREQSPVSQFEAAVDATVSGEAAILERLLRERPALVRERSTRDHRSTLLHYVSANGIEDFRQKTPPNIVEIARILLDAGSDVNAESDAYRGGSTTLGLTATSWHPEKAGVQIPLLELMLERGAMIDAPDGGSTVNACLHNGRGRAAEFLADRGAKLDFEGAAGVGRIDVVQNSFLNATARQIEYGFAWACEFGRLTVVDFLLHAGVDPNVMTEHAETGLHWAALGGKADIVRMLLAHGATIDRQDAVHHGTPLGWGLYAWSNLPDGADDTGFCQTITTLVRAGAKVDPELLRRVANQHMRRALQGEDC